MLEGPLPIVYDQLILKETACEQTLFQIPSLPSHF